MTTPTVRLKRRHHQPHGRRLEEECHLLEGSVAGPSGCNQIRKVGRPLLGRAKHLIRRVAKAQHRDRRDPQRSDTPLQCCELAAELITCLFDVRPVDCARGELPRAPDPPLTPTPSANPSHPPAARVAPALRPLPHPPPPEPQSPSSSPRGSRARLRAQPCVPPPPLWWQ
jgi:hypothetical protein